MAEYDFESIDTVSRTRRFHVSEKVLLLLKGTGTTRIFVQTSMIVRFQNAKKQTQIAIQHADLDTLTLFCIVIIFNKGQRSWSCEQLNVRGDAIPKSDAYRKTMFSNCCGMKPVLLLVDSGSITHYWHSLCIAHMLFCMTPWIKASGFISATPQSKWEVQVVLYNWSMYFCRWYMVMQLYLTRVRPRDMWFGAWWLKTKMFCS